MGFSDQEEQTLNSSETLEINESDSVDSTDSTDVEAELTDAEAESSAEEQTASDSGESSELVPAEAELSDSESESSAEGQEEIEPEEPSEAAPLEAEAADSEQVSAPGEQEELDPEEPSEAAAAEAEAADSEPDAAPDEQEELDPEEPSEAASLETELSDEDLESGVKPIVEPEVEGSIVDEEAIPSDSEISQAASTPVPETEPSAVEEDGLDISLDFLDEDQAGAIDTDEEERSWFVVHCYSGYENKVRHNLEQRIETMGMKDKIFDIVVPTEEEIEVRDGKRRTVERRVFPGYILVNMVMTEESWYVVRNTPGVTGFVGMGNNPTPLRPEEVSQIIKRMEAEAPRIKVTFKAGERVRIVDGPFNDFRGTVSEIDMERAKVRVMVNFFGRETPVELDFLQVEKT